MARRHAQNVYVEAERTINERSRALLMDTPNPRKSCPTAKTAVFGASCNLPLLLIGEID